MPLNKDREGGRPYVTVQGGPLKFSSGVKFDVSQR